MRFRALAFFLLASVISLQVLGREVQQTSQGKEEVIYETATLTGFAGRSFQFNGCAGAHYVLLAEQSHQLVARFQRSEEPMRITSYIDALGLAYQNHTVLVQLQGSSAFSVTLDGELLRSPDAGGEVLEYRVNSQDPGNTLSIAWQVVGSAGGPIVVLRTGLLSLAMFLAPGEEADGLDPAVAQPAFLNFDIALFREPEGRMEGVIGRTYERLLAGQAADTPGHPLFEENDSLFHGVTSDYATAGFFELATAHNLVSAGNAGSSTAAYRRRLLQTPTFPLSAAGRVG